VQIARKVKPTPVTVVDRVVLSEYIREAKSSLAIQEYYDEEFRKLYRGTKMVPSLCIDATDTEDVRWLEAVMQHRLFDPILDRSLL
jgi:hypothetical protein